MKWLALVLVASMPALADVAPPPPADVKPVAEAQPQLAPPPADPVAAPAPPAPAQEHPGGNQNAPGMQNMGVIEGGWAYVYAAWGVGVLGVLLYAASLFLRRSDAPPPGAP